MLAAHVHRQKEAAEQADAARALAAQRKREKEEKAKKKSDARKKPTKERLEVGNSALTQNEPSQVTGPVPSQFGSVSGRWCADTWVSVSAHSANETQP